MTQLWLDGQRIDSIALLRRFFGECENKQQWERLLSELIRKYQAGVLGRWLMHQQEARSRPLLSAALNKDKQLKLDLLLKEPMPLTQELTELIVRLCTEDENLQAECMAYLSDMEQELSDNVHQLNAEKKKRAEACAWYHELRRLFEHIDWNNAATEPEELREILSRIREEDSGTQTTVYLCNTERNYRIDHPMQLRGVRLVGCGNPRVYFGSQNRGKRLDMKKQDLCFEGFVLYAQGMILAGTQERLSSVEER